MIEKKMIRHIVDMLMIIVLPLLMAFELIGRATHEWLGVSMLLLVIVHQGLNWKWYRNLLHGKYTAMRAVTLVLDFALIALMILQAVSGISMARHLPDAVPALLRRSVARSIHMTCAYWCFTFMCVHAGFHMNALTARMKQRFSPVAFSMLRIAVWLVALYGMYAFVKRQLPGYMFMQIQFAFFDYEVSLICFFADYLAVMALFLLLGHLLGGVLRKGKRR